MSEPTASPSHETTPEHPGVADLFAILACGEIEAFYRLTADAALAPHLAGRVALASMAAAEMQHYETLAQALTSRGLDPITAMEPFAGVLEKFHRSTKPSTWLESMVKAYVGDGLAADLYSEIVEDLPPEIGGVVKAVMAETSHSDFVIAEVRSAVADNEQQRSRLTLWSRRLLGEAITQAQYVLAERESLTDLVLTGSPDLNRLVTLFDRVQERHAQRMTALGL